MELPKLAEELTGRGADLDWLRAMARASRASAPRTVVLTGPTGVGTTALAITLARQLTRDFPGGQFFVNLRANSDRPLHPGAAMGMLLGALGVPRDGIPTELEARARLYRSLLHGRRALIVLDNAVSEAQVQPLLPVSSTCLVMITSRQPLTGLTAVQRLQVEPLAEHEAMAVLGRAVGPHRATAQQEQLRHLARLCGRLPLALRLVGGMLAGHPQLPAVELSKHLLEAGRRIAPTVRGSVPVHAALAVAYRLLRPAAQLALRRLALSPEARYCAEVVSVLTEVTSTEGTAILNELAVSGLLNPVADRDQYTCHEVVRAFAEDRLREESDPIARFAAENRLLDWLIHTAISISSVYEQPKPGALGRFAARDHRLGVDLAGVEEFDRLRATSAVDITTVPQEGRALHLLRQALVLARRLGDKRKEGYVLLYLGTANERLQRHQEGVDHYLRSAAVFREIGSRTGEAAALGNIAHAATPAQRITM
ncbi:hypothetical protein JOF53_003346 [Crossiella equi]|uniref:AAA+ ATPase domain-containing protein n=1 Tax=Crossiella equi TaxID=130796 RepID=A0ABS5AE38_9PSEU|nr:NB-ARC domain-containing protein [Crossiella equi]MBP2474474.1 hypothetical protein [Crossiella equi]